MNAYLISRAPMVRAIVEATTEPPSRDTPALFLPPDASDIVHPPECFWDASKAEPYARLPRYLVLTVSWWQGAPRGWQPPKFHYGWRPNVEKLLSYAAERNLTVTCSDRESSWYLHHQQNILRPRPRDTRCLQDNVDPASDHISPAQVQTEEMWPSLSAKLLGADPQSEVDVYATLRAALRRMMQDAWEAGVLAQWCTQCDVAFTLRVDEGRNFVVSVMNSYVHLTLWREPDILRPTFAELGELARMLGVSGPPRWYVDRDICQWLRG